MMRFGFNMKKRTAGGLGCELQAHRSRVANFLTHQKKAEVNAIFLKGGVMEETEFVSSTKPLTKT